VVVYRLFRSTSAAAAAGAAALAMFLVAWYVLPLVARAARRVESRATAHA
jgi:hypothetical protein